MGKLQRLGSHHYLLRWVSSHPSHPCWWVKGITVNTKEWCFSHWHGFKLGNVNKLIEWSVDLVSRAKSLLPLELVYSSFCPGDRHWSNKSNKPKPLKPNLLSRFCLFSGCFFAKKNVAPKNQKSYYVQKLAPGPSFTKKNHHFDVPSQQSHAFFTFLRL